MDDNAPFYRKLAETAEHMFLVFDPVGTVSYVSAAVNAMVGTTPDEGLGTNVIDYLAPGELDHALEALAYKLEHPDAPFRPLDVRLNAHLDDARPRRTCEIVGRPGTDAENEGIAVLIREVTRRTMLHDIIDSVMRSEPIEGTLARIAGLASEQLRLGGVAIAFQPTGDEVACVVTTGLTDALAERAHRFDAGSPWHDAVTTGEIVRRTHDQLPGDLRALAADTGYRGCWSAPMQDHDGRMIGSITMWMPDDIDAAPAERDYLRKLCRTAVFAFDRWLRDQAMAHAASHDALTGIYNRTTFGEHVAALVSSEAGDGHVGDPAAAGNCLLSIDLDGFKAINDRHGHLAGDQVLVAVARRICGAVRGGDLVARMGGDEFAVLCPGLDSTEEATVVADRIIRSVQQPVAIGGVEVLVGASVGIAFAIAASPVDRMDRIDGPWVDGLFARADSALYAAKAAGKGRWQLAAAS